MQKRDGLSRPNMRYLTADATDLCGFAAVVAYSDGDDAGTRDALHLLHTIALDATDHPYFGPELVTASEAARARRPDQTVTVHLDGGRRAWIDGQLIGGGERLELVPGSHLIQASNGTTSSAEWVAIESDSFLDVGEGIRVWDMPAASEQALSVPVAQEAASVPPSAVGMELPRSPRRGHRTGLLVTGALTAAAGGGALVYAWQSENQFKTDPYNGDTYGGCALADDCYGRARIDAIQGDATRIRAAYLVGYGLTALGVGLVGTELFILPAPRASGGQVGVRGRF